MPCHAQENKMKCPVGDLMEPIHHGKIAKVLDYLKEGNTLNGMECVEKFGSTRLAAIVFSLKNSGHDILTEIEKDGDKNVVCYRYIGEMDPSHIKADKHHSLAAKKIAALACKEVVNKKIGNALKVFGTAIEDTSLVVKFELGRKKAHINIKGGRFIKELGELLENENAEIDAIEKLLEKYDMESLDIESIVFPAKHID